MMQIDNTRDLREAMRHGKHAWPGGYPTYFVCHDGEALSFEAVRDNYKEVLRAVKDKDHSGWQVIGYDVNWEDAELVCAHTGKRIESAYAEDEVGEHCGI